MASGGYQYMTGTTWLPVEQQRQQQQPAPCHLFLNRRELSAGMAFLSGGDGVLSVAPSCWSADAAGPRPPSSFFRERLRCKPAKPATVCQPGGRLSASSRSGRVFRLRPRVPAHRQRASDRVSSLPRMPCEHLAPFAVLIACVERVPGGHLLSHVNRSNLPTDSTLNTAV